MFKAVGLIEYPRKGIYCLVFVTEVPGPEITEASGETLRSVFLPTTPNPTSGFLLMLPEKDIKRIPMSVEEGLKMVISGGAYVPGRGISWGPDAVPVRLKGRNSWWRRLLGMKPSGEMVVEPSRDQKTVTPGDEG